MKFKNKYFWLFLFCLFILIPLMVTEPKFGHDISFHLENIELFAKYFSFDSIKQAFFILPDTANHLGYGIGIFYPMLPHMVGAILYKVLSIFSIPSIYCVYLIYFFVLYGASIVVYKLAYKLHHNESIAFLSSCIFITMPYVLGNLFIRYAYNEVFLFLFFPCVVLGLISLMEDSRKEFFLYFTIGCIGMIWSHLVMTLFAALFLFPLLILYFQKIFKKENRKVIFLSVSIILLFTLPNMILLLEHYLSGNYLVNLKDYMTSLELIQENLLSLKEFVIPYKDYDWGVAHYIPIFIFIMFLYSIILYFKNRRKKTILYFNYFFCLFLVLGLMISKIFPYQVMPNILYMIQFPWRLFSFFILPLSMIAPLCCLYIKNEKIKKYGIGIILGLILVLQIPFYHKLLSRPYVLKDYYDSNVTETAMGHSYEYLPVNALKNWIDRENEMKLLAGDGDVMIIKNKGIEFEFLLSNIQNEVTIELPKLYYYGYKIVDEENNTYDSRMSQDGYIEITLSKNGIYQLEYVGTEAYQILSKIRLVGGMIFVVFLPFYIVKRKNMV